MSDNFKPYRKDGVAITIVFQAHEIPKAVIDLKPEIITDGPNKYLCTLGNVVEGISGAGRTPLAAMQDFTREYKRRIKARTVSLKVKRKA